LCPLVVQAWLHQHFDLGFMPACPDPLQSRIACEMTRLLTRREMGLLFPTSRIVAERWFVFVKSFIAIGSADALATSPGGVSPGSAPTHRLAAGRNLLPPSPVTSGQHP
jgi:hypothetical protein